MKNILILFALTACVAAIGDQNPKREAPETLTLQVQTYNMPDDVKRALDKLLKSGTIKKIKVKR